MLFIDDLLLAPITGFQFIMRTLAKVAEEQYTDDAPLKERLLELQMRLDSGEIGEEEYAEEEGAIMRELREVQHRKMEMAGVSREEVESMSVGDRIKQATEQGAGLTVERFGEFHEHEK